MATCSKNAHVFSGMNNGLLCLCGAKVNFCGSIIDNRMPQADVKLAPLPYNDGPKRMCGLCRTGINVGHDSLTVNGMFAHTGCVESALRGPREDFTVLVNDRAHVEDLGEHVRFTCENGLTKVSIGKTPMARALGVVQGKDAERLLGGITNHELCSEVRSRKLEPCHGQVLADASDEQLLDEVRERKLWVTHGNGLPIATDDQLRAECERRGIDTMTPEMTKAWAKDREHYIRRAEVAEAATVEEDSDPALMAAAYSKMDRALREDFRRRTGLKLGIEIKDNCRVCGAPEGKGTPSCDDDAVFDVNVQPFSERGPGIGHRSMKTDRSIDIATLADLLADDAR